MAQLRVRIDASSDTTRAIREYRDLLAYQATMPEAQRWTLGSAIKQAKAKAYAEIEYARCGLRAI